MPDNAPHSPENWYQVLESNRQFAIGSVLIISIAILVVISLRNPVDYDGYWHLQMGKDLVENGLSPYQDNYSFTYENETITAPPVIFQVALYTLVKLFGEWGGFITIKLLAFLLTLGCMMAWLKQIKAPALIYCLVLPMLVMLIQLRAQVRPELFSYSLCIMALMLYRRANQQLTVKAIGPIVVFLLFWINYHSSILGYVIFFGLFIDIGLKLFTEKKGMNTWLVWASWGLLLVTVGILNPSMSHPVYSALTFPDTWKSLIQEYRSSFEAYRNFPSIYLLTLLTAMTLVMAFRQRKIGYFVFGGIMFYSYLSTARLVTPMGIVFLGMFAHVMSDTRIQNALKSQTKQQLRLSLPVALVIFLITMWEDVSFVRNSMFVNRYFPYLFPERLTSYMLDNNKAGRIFNEYSMGGYLIYRLSPDSQVYIDGRTGILYPVQHYLNHDMARDNGKVMSKEIKKYNIDFAILNSDAYSAWTMLLADELKLDFSDVKFALYSRESPSLPTTGLLWARPYCWTKALAPALSRERESALSNHSPLAPIMPLLALATEYASAEDPVHWLTNLGPEDTWNDESKRFAGYRALDHGLDDIAIKLFTAIPVKDVKDFLAIAMAHHHNNREEQAEQYLKLASSTRWARLETNDLVVMRGLLAEIKEKQPLKHMKKEFVDSVYEQVATFAHGTKGRSISVASFCGNNQ